MRIGAFELSEPVQELHDPHILAVLRPWIDVGSVGTMALNLLERHYGAVEMGSLHRPGEFYDFTRYRPTLYRREGERHIVVPNSVVRGAKGKGEHDWLFLHLLEPHNRGEDLMEAVVALLERFHVSRYCLLGGMYGAWPHTRPLMLSGGGSDPGVQQQLERAGVRTSRYEGPTSIMSMVTDEAQRMGTEILTMLVQLPPYARLEEDYKGQETLLSRLGALYHWDLDLSEVAGHGAQQYAELDRAMRADRQMQGMVHRLEEAYDAEMSAEAQESQGDTDLPSVVQDFLRDLEQGRGNSP